MNVINDISEDLLVSVKDHSNAMLMLAHSCASWIKNCLQSKYNFVSSISGMKLYERKEHKFGDSNIISFKLGVICIFDRSPFSKESDSSERPFPLVRTIIGNDALADVEDLNKNELTICFTGGNDCRIEQSDAKSWKSPLYDEEKNIIEAKSTQVVYFGFIYLLSVAIAAGFDPKKINQLPFDKLLEDVLAFAAVNLPKFLN